jgi:uncharacterized circularly permuted ATP-grasp superfamily protein
MAKIDASRGVRPRLVEPVRGNKTCAIPRRHALEPAAAPIPSARETMPSARSSRAGQSVLSARAAASALPANLISPFKLRLKNADGELVEVRAANYYLDPTGAPRREIADVAAVALGRRPAAQAEIDRRITAQHARHEMSFKTKIEDASAFFKVPCYGGVLPLSEVHFRTLVKSTQPIMRALRAMLQTIYSKPGFTAQDLGIQDIPPEDRERVLTALKRSVYFEPRMVDPAMKDYPFLSVFGFDAAIGDPSRVDPIFFEYNGGTPSGLSNNIQLLEILRREDPELFSTIAPRLLEDETFAILRRAIESNALAWTKNPHGISVALSPGVGNGAHPDVASIAMYSGMPMVNPSDLYEDARGDIRLNTGGKSDPIVTGIYGRMEESYFLQNREDGIPIRGPHYFDAAETDTQKNPELGQKFGLKLEPGIFYWLRLDDAGRITGVRTDEDGSPMLQPVFESIGRDPSRPDVAPGSFGRAIKNRKLYYSGLGGRVVDDKRVFQAIAQHVARRYVEEPDAPIASPPPTLNPSEYWELYLSECLGDYVIKDPDKSGGEGVKLMCMLSAEEQRRVVESVRADEHGKIVQRRAAPAVMMVPEASGRSTKPNAFGTIMPDWRIFAIMDGEGNVDAGPSSFLVRAARPFSLSTNTSQGASYAIGAIVGEPRVEAVDHERSILPAVPLQTHVGASRLFDLEQFFTGLDEITKRADPESGLDLPRDGRASLLADFQREIFELLGREHSPMMTMARSYDAGEIGREDLYHALLSFRAGLLGAERFTADIRALVRERLGRWMPPSKKHDRARSADRAKLLERLNIEPLAAPVCVRTQRDRGGEVYKLEVGRYLSAPHPFIESTIAELHAAGGEMRRVRLNGSEDGSGPWLDQIANAEFRLDADGRPIIDIDLLQDGAVSGLAHERDHFLRFLRWKKKLLDEGLSPKEAAFAALKTMNEPAHRRESEKSALAAEMERDRADRTQWNEGARSRAQGPGDDGWVGRVAYPQVEAIRDLLHRARWGGEWLDEAAALEMLERLIMSASENRRASWAALLGRADMLDRSAKLSDRVEAEKTRIRAYALRDASLFETVFDQATQARFESDQTVDELQRLWAIAHAVAIAPRRARWAAADLARMQHAQQ